MRDEYEKFTRRNAVVMAVGPNAVEVFKRYWANENIPFIGLPNPDHSVAKAYRQEVNIFKAGRMPLNCVIDVRGRVRYAHYGASMRDIPTNEELLHVLDQLNMISN